MHFESLEEIGKDKNILHGIKSVNEEPYIEERYIKHNGKSVDRFKNMNTNEDTRQLNKKIINRNMKSCLSSPQLEKHVRNKDVDHTNLIKNARLSLHQLKKTYQEKECKENKSRWKENDEK